MARKSVSVGEVFLIPIDKNKFIPGKVLFVESRVKNVIQVALYSAIFTSKSEPVDLPIDFDRVLYTSQEPIQHGDWPSVGFHELRDNESGLSERLIGDAVWFENEKLRIASNEELSKIPKMGVCNQDWVREDAEEIADKLRK